MSFPDWLIKENLILFLPEYLRLSSSNYRENIQLSISQSKTGKIFSQV
ncbi:hypothetical protein [Dapis sp. BLCC M172]